MIPFTRIMISTDETWRNERNIHELVKKEAIERGECYTPHCIIHQGLIRCSRFVTQTGTAIAHRFREYLQIHSPSRMRERSFAPDAETHGFMYDNTSGHLLGVAAHAIPADVGTDAH